MPWISWTVAKVELLYKGSDVNEVKKGVFAWLACLSSYYDLSGLSVLSVNSSNSLQLSNVISLSLFSQTYLGDQTGVGAGIYSISFFSLLAG